MPGIESNVPRYLQNTDQVLEPEESSFSGEIPPWLKGTIFSSSPGVFDLQKGSVNNWFDGYSIISKFEIDGRQVSFTSKYLQSNAYAKAVEAGRPVMPEFGTPPWSSNRKLFAKLVPFGPYDCTDNTMGTIFKLGSSLYTAGDTCYYHEIDPMTLDTLRTHHAYRVFGMNSISSQPLEDEDGNVYLIGGAIQPTFRYSVLKMDAKTRLEENKPLEKRFSPLLSFPSRWLFGACPCRNFGMTSNYIIMVEQPLVLNLMKLAATYVKGYSTMDWLDWRPNDGVRFCLIHKENGELLKTEVFSANPFFTPTIINAFEDGDEIVLDLISMPNLDCNEATRLENLRNRPDRQISEEERPLDSGTIHRYIIPIVQKNSQIPPGDEETLLKLPTKSYPSYKTVKAIRKADKVIVTPEILSKPGLGMDFQVINPQYRGRRYNFVYTTSGYISTSFSPFAYGIAKLNLGTKEVLMWVGERDQVPSEPIFIPNPNGTLEDDGILLTLVKMERDYDQDDFLVMVDAKNMSELGRAPFKSPIAGWHKANFFK